MNRHFDLNSRVPLRDFDREPEDRHLDDQPHGTYAPIVIITGLLLFAWASWHAAKVVEKIWN